MKGEKFKTSFQMMILQLFWQHDWASDKI